MPSKSEVRLILDPTLRLKELSDVGSGVNVDNAVPVQRYLRSGPQMEKMVNSLILLIVLVCNQHHYWFCSFIG